MFRGLSEKLGTVFDRLRGKGALTEADVDMALKEVRVALLEADVALPVARNFIDAIRDKAIGTEVLKSVTPGQMVVKVVHDALVELLGPEDVPLNLHTTPPSVVLMLGLQGSGKTTTAGKLAKLLRTREKKSVMLASLDVSRPAAREQLRILAEQAGCDALPEKDGETPVMIARRALEAARLKSSDVLILDTAGRTTVDAALMAEASEISAVANPVESLLVADAMTGQDAVNTATAFTKVTSVTGIILTRAEGDARAGAALSMREITNCPIKYLGTGEKQDDLETFSASRMAGRILGMGDVVGLVEKAAETIEVAEAEKIASRLAKGQFDMNDFLAQLRQLKKMGGMGGLLNMLPGVGKIKKAIEAAGIDDGFFRRQEAIILSMTKGERTQVALLNASRRRRIAQGSGSSVQDVNKLVKQYQDMAKMIKKMGKVSGGNPAALASMFGGGGDAISGAADGGMSPSGLPGLGGLPGLSGMPRSGGLNFPLSKHGGKKRKK